MLLAPADSLSTLRVIVVGLALLWVPGWFVQSLFLRRQSLPPLSRLSLPFVFSVGSIALIGAVVSALSGSLSTVQGCVAVWWLALTIAWLIHTKFRKLGLIPRFQLTDPNFWPSLLVLFFAAGCAVLAYYGGAWLSQTADSFYHLAAIRRQIELGSALPHGLFYVYEQPSTVLNVTAGTWHLVLTLFSLWSGVDITWLWLRLPVLLAPLLVVSFYSFANALFKNAWIALLGTLIQFVLYDKLDFRISPRSNQVGFVLLWVAFVLVFTYLDEANLRVFLLIEGLVVVLVTWHLLMAEFFLIGIGAYLCLRWLATLVTRRRISLDQESRRLLYLLLPAVLVGVPFVLFKAAGGGILYAKKNWLGISRPTFGSTIQLGAGFTMIGPFQLHRVDPRWHFAPLRFALWLFAYFTSLFLIPPALKLRRFALFLFAPVAVVAFVLPNPFIITFLQGKMTDIGLLRLVLLPAYGLILGWFFWEYTGRWFRAIAALPAVARWSYGGTWRSVLGLIAAGVALVLMGYIVIQEGIDNLRDLYSPSSTHKYSFARSRSEMHLSTQPPYVFLMEHSLPGTVVASDPEYSYYLGGMTGRSVIAVPYTHTPPSTGPRFEVRFQDSLDILDPSIGLDQTAELLDKYDVCLVWIDSRMTSVDPAASREKFERHPALFERVYSDPLVSAYRYLAHEGMCVQ